MAQRREMARSMSPATWTDVDQMDRSWSRWSMSRGAWTAEMSKELSPLLARSGWSGSPRGARHSAA